jgi:hypothetical protein
MADDPKKILRELVDEVLDEMTGTGAVAGYATPHAFRGNKSKKKAAERSMPGGKVVGTEDETDGTTVGINEEDRLPILRRTLAEADMKGKKCEACKKGTYEETSEQDDMHGELHCTNCGKMVKRHLEEGRYRNFKTDESMKSHTKVCFGISEAKKMLREVEFLVSIVERLKSEDGVDKAQLWKRTKKDLSEINKRTKAIARRVYRIGKQ